MILRYNGNGEGIIGVPAMDLDDSELSRLQESFDLDRNALIELLCSRGLYSLPPQPKTPRKHVTENEGNENGSSN